MASGQATNSVAWHLNNGESPPISGSEISPTAYAGSMQEILRQNTGNYVICEFLIGTQSLQRKEGILYSVGVSFLVIYEVYSQSYVVCDFYSLKFVTFLDPATLAQRGISIPALPMA